MAGFVFGAEHRVPRSFVVFVVCCVRRLRLRLDVFEFCLHMFPANARSKFGLEACV